MYRLYLALAFLGGLLSRAGADEPVLNPSNGHYYARVDMSQRPVEQRTWQTALMEAASMSYDGMPGYLVTITTPSEQDFLKQLAPFPSDQISGEWIGASDLEVEGDWRWVTGPEAGTLFWRGNHLGEAVGFQDWFLGEPNDWQGNEDYAMFNWLEPGAWNDQSNEGSGGNPKAFIVEFSRPVPEPSGIILALGGASGLGVVIMRGRRAITQTSV